MATRYKISKEQLERVVENFVMEAASKAPVKNMIPSQGAEAKKHVKNKMTGKMVEKGEGVPSVNTMKKKLSQAPESKKHMSNSKMTHSNKAKVVKESGLEEGKYFGEHTEGKDRISAQLDDLLTKSKKKYDKEKLMAYAKEQDDWNGEFELKNDILSYNSKSKNWFQDKTINKRNSG